MKITRGGRNLIALWRKWKAVRASRIGICGEIFCDVFEENTLPENREEMIHLLDSITAELRARFRGETDPDAKARDAVCINLYEHVAARLRLTQQRHLTV